MYINLLFTVWIGTLAPELGEHRHTIDIHQHLVVYALPNLTLKRDQIDPNCYIPLPQHSGSDMCKYQYLTQFKKKETDIYRRK